MTKVLRSQPLTPNSDALARPRRSKALQIEAPKLAYDPVSGQGDGAAEPSMQSASCRGAFFIVGYEVTPDKPGQIGSLLLAAYHGHEIVHIGNVRADLNDAEARELRKMLDALRWKQKTPPIRCEIKNLGAANIVWAYPTLIAAIAFRGWSDCGMIEQATYQGLAERQDNADVFRLEQISDTGETSARR